MIHTLHKKEQGWFTVLFLRFMTTTTSWSRYHTKLDIAHYTKSTANTNTNTTIQH